MPWGTVERGWVTVRLYMGTLELQCKGSRRDAQPGEGAVKWVWQRGRPFPLYWLQVSSYGGTLHYELHSETQRGDVFIPYESRPDVVLQVVARGGM